MAKSMRERFLEAKDASMAFSKFCEIKAVPEDHREFTKLEFEAERTRKELSNALESFHGITLDELQSI